MIRQLLLWALCSCTALSAAAEGRTFIGFATDPSSGELRYREIHREWADAEGDRLETSYVGPGGEVLAVREVDFSGDDLAPAFRLEDLRTGRVVGMDRVGGGVEPFRRSSATDQIERRRLEEPSLLVADAGFDRFVAAVWDRLVAGEAVEAEFLAPSRLRTVRCTMRRVAEGTDDGQPTVTFRMGAANALIRLVAPEVDVTYHRQSRRLLRYEGPSNIRGVDGRPMVVRIDFPQPEPPGASGERKPSASLAGAPSAVRRDVVIDVTLRRASRDASQERRAHTGDHEEDRDDAACCHADPPGSHGDLGRDRSADPLPPGGGPHLRI